MGFRFFCKNQVSSTSAQDSFSTEPSEAGRVLSPTYLESHTRDKVKKARDACAVSSTSSGTEARLLLEVEPVAGNLDIFITCAIGRND